MGVTLTFDGTPQIIVQRCQIAAPSWPSDITSAANNAIFKNRAQSFIWKYYFFSFAKIGNISQRCSSVYTTIFVRRKDNPHYLSNQTWKNFQFKLKLLFSVSFFFLRNYLKVKQSTIAEIRGLLIYMHLNFDFIYCRLWKLQFYGLRFKFAITLSSAFSTFEWGNFKKYTEMSNAMRDLLTWSFSLPMWWFITF